MKKELKIITVNKKEEEKFLRRRTADFDFNKFTKKEINDLVKSMKATMIAKDGIGLAANQVGLDMRLFVVQIMKLDRRGNPRSPTRTEQKFYAIFNPEIIKKSEEKTILEEGCLSVPDAYGEVMRPEKITIAGYDKNGRKTKIKAWGLLARVFQHEVDHLNGTLYIDKVKNLKRVENKK